MNHILIVDDSPEIFDPVRNGIQTSSHIEWAKSVKEATRLLDQSHFDLILLDVVLPDGDGFHLCSLLRNTEQLKHTPVIFLSGRNTVTDKVMGFTIGGDDYISKPFDILEVKARIDALLRKRAQRNAELEIIRTGEPEINKSTQIVSAITEGEFHQFELTPMEFRLLLFLAQKPETVFSRDEILNAVWGDNIHVYSRSVDTHISKLRKKLGPFAAHVRSVHGTGYKFSERESISSRLM